MEKNDTSEAIIKSLSPRQVQVLQLVAQGYTSREIAEEIELSVHTVRVHRAQLMQRLNVHNVAELISLAYKAGLLSARQEESSEGSRQE